VSVMDLLVGAGADIEALTIVKQTPLFWACGRGQASAAEYLLSRGAAVNCQDGNGDTPLHRHGCLARA